MHFFNYVMRKGQECLYISFPWLLGTGCHWFLFFLPVWLHQTRIGLSLYDVAGQGYLRESVSISIKTTTTCKKPMRCRKHWKKPECLKGLNLV